MGINFQSTAKITMLYAVNHYKVYRFSCFMLQCPYRLNTHIISLTTSAFFGLEVRPVINWILNVLILTPIIFRYGEEILILKCPFDKKRISKSNYKCNYIWNDLKRGNDEHVYN